MLKKSTLPADRLDNASVSISSLAVTSTTKTASGVQFIFKNNGTLALTVTLDIDVVAVGDIVPADNLAYLLKYDSTQGRFGGKDSRGGKPRWKT